MPEPAWLGRLALLLLVLLLALPLASHALARAALRQAPATQGEVRVSTGLD